MSLSVSAQHDPALRRLMDQVLAAVDQREPLAIRGGGTKSFYGGPEQGVPLDVRPLAGISSLEPTELVVTARAGTPLSELEAALAEVGQCLPFEPPRFAPGGTVGGMVAAGLSGPARASVGALRDYVLGVTLLNGRGEVLTFGGQVIKNVAGYDVPRLMAGAMGVLGVVCEVSLKVLPITAARATLVFDMDAAKAMHQCALWAGRPLPINATAWHDGRLQVRLAGARAAVQSARASLGGASMADDDATAWWDAVRDQRHAFFGNGNGNGNGSVIGTGTGIIGTSAAADSSADAANRARPTLWRLSVPPTRPPLPLPGTWFIEWGGALRWLRSDASAAAVHAAASAAGGHATRFRTCLASAAAAAPPAQHALPPARATTDRRAEPHAPIAEPLLGIHRRLKAAFDPAGIFNPGRLHPTL